MLPEPREVKPKEVKPKAVKPVVGEDETCPECGKDKGPHKQLESSTYVVEHTLANVGKFAISVGRRSSRPKTTATPPSRRPMTWPILPGSFRWLTATATAESPSPVKGVFRAAVEVVALVVVEAAINAAVNAVALVAVKAVVKVAMVGVVGEKPTQNKRTGPKGPLLKRITIVIPRCRFNATLTSMA